jgi:hypothetical protein
MQVSEKTIQLLTLIAVIGGLVLVIWELRQVGTLARAQLSSDYVGEMNALHGSVSGETLAAALAKACEAPESLTLEESMVVTNYYYASLNLVARLHLLSERDGVYPTDYWREQIGFLNPIVGSSYGRAWLRQIEGRGFPDGLIEAGIEYMNKTEPDQCLKAHQERLNNVDA